MGEKSAEYSLIEGPYKIFIKSKEIEKFAKETIPLIWTTFYTKGKLDSSIKNNIIDIKVVDLPVNHLYFEMVVMGYVKRALELVEQKALNMKL